MPPSRWLHWPGLRSLAREGLQPLAASMVLLKASLQATALLWLFVGSHRGQAAEGTMMTAAYGLLPALAVLHIAFHPQAADQARFCTLEQLPQPRHVRSSLRKTVIKQRQSCSPTGQIVGQSSGAGLTCNPQKPCPSGQLAACLLYVHGHAWAGLLIC